MNVVSLFMQLFLHYTLLFQQDVIFTGKCHFKLKQIPKFTKLCQNNSLAMLFCSKITKLCQILILLKLQINKL